MKVDYIREEIYMSNYMVKLWATWFTCGNAKKAPGTIGTLGAIPLYLLINSLRDVMSDRIYNSLYFLFLIILKYYQSFRSKKTTLNNFFSKKCLFILIIIVLLFSLLKNTDCYKAFINNL